MAATSDSAAAFGGECGPSSPRTRWHEKLTLSMQVIVSVLLKLSPEKIASIKKHFDVNDKPLNASEFNKVMLKHVLSGSYQRNAANKDLENRKRTTISNLSELFDQIDINGDGTIGVFLEYRSSFKTRN